MDNELSTSADSLNVKSRHDPKAFIMMLSLAIMALTAIAVLATQLSWPNF